MKIASTVLLAFALTSCLNPHPERIKRSSSAASQDGSPSDANPKPSPKDDGKDDLGGKDDDEKDTKPDVPEVGDDGNQDPDDPEVPEDPEIKPDPKPEPKPEPEPDPMESDCYKGDAFICEIERIIAQETNRLRATSGKGALVHALDHAFISRLWSEQMAKAGRIGHDGFPAQRKVDFQKEFGKSTNYYAENVAMLSDSGSDAAKIAGKFVNMWWNSAGHKANMLRDHKNIGAGVAKKGNSYYATQLFN